MRMGACTTGFRPRELAEPAYAAAAYAAAAKKALPFQETEDGVTWSLQRADQTTFAARVEGEGLTMTSISNRQQEPIPWGPCVPVKL